MSNEESRIHFWQPENVSIGDIVWVYESNTLSGPLFVHGHHDIGYGSNRKLMYVLLDASSGGWHQSEKKWLRVPMEIT